MTRPLLKDRENALMQERRIERERDFQALFGELAGNLPEKVGSLAFGLLKEVEEVAVQARTTERVLYDPLQRSEQAIRHLAVDGPDHVLRLQQDERAGDLSQRIAAVDFRSAS